MEILCDREFILQALLAQCCQVELADALKSHDDAVAVNPLLARRFEAEALQQACGGSPQSCPPAHPIASPPVLQPRRAWIPVKADRRCAFGSAPVGDARGPLLLLCRRRWRHTMRSASTLLTGLISSDEHSSALLVATSQHARASFIPNLSR
jgi:hypothetical protein